MLNKEINSLLEREKRIARLNLIKEIYMDDQFWQEPLECVERYMSQIAEESKSYMNGGKE